MKELVIYYFYYGYEDDGSKFSINKVSMSSNVRMMSLIKFYYIQVNDNIYE